MERRRRMVSWVALSLLVLGTGCGRAATGELAREAADTRQPGASSPGAAPISNAANGSGGFAEPKPWDSTCGAHYEQQDSGFQNQSDAACAVWFGKAPAGDYAVHFHASLAHDWTLGLWVGSYRGGDVQGRIVEYDSRARGVLFGDYAEELDKWQHASTEQRPASDWRFVRTGKRVALVIGSEYVFVGEVDFVGPELGFRTRGLVRLDQAKLDFVTSGEAARIAALPLTGRPGLRAAVASSAPAAADAPPRAPSEASKNRVGLVRALIGKRAWEVLGPAELVAKFQRLLGRDYSAFQERLGVGSALTEDGDYVVGMGFMAGRGGSEEAYFAIGMTNGELHAAIRSGDAVRSFTSTGKAPPPELTRLFDITEDRTRQPYVASATMIRACSGTMGPATKGRERLEQHLPKKVDSYVLEEARTLTCKHGVEVWSTYRSSVSGATMVVVVQLGSGARVPTELLSEYRPGLKARVFDTNLWVQYHKGANFFETSTGDPRILDYFFEHFSSSSITQAYRASRPASP